MNAPIRKSFAKGTVIFREGEAGNQAFLVQSGSVRIFKTLGGKRITIGVVRPGQIFGELALIDNGLRMGAAMAEEESACLIMSQSGITHMLDNAPEGLTNLMKSLIATMRTMGDDLAHARAELAELKQT